ncbi:MAG: hypothetical protein JNJ59_23625 [Deltaproteobacteria bacterium]|nr:hypothetical protein [Deltaproteobacteria bacterium]
MSTENVAALGGKCFAKDFTIVGVHGVLLREFGITLTQSFSSEIDRAFSAALGATLGSDVPAEKSASLRAAFKDRLRTKFAGDFQGSFKSKRAVFYPLWINAKRQP